MYVIIDVMDEIDENLVTTILLIDEEILNLVKKGGEKQKADVEEESNEVVLSSTQNALDTLNY